MSAQHILIWSTNYEGVDIHWHIYLTGTANLVFQSLAALKVATCKCWFVLALVGMPVQSQLTE